MAVIPADDALEVVFVQPVSNCPLEKSQQFCRHLPLSSTIYSYTIRMDTYGITRKSTRKSTMISHCLGINCDKGCLACLRAGLPLQNRMHKDHQRPGFRWTRSDKAGQGWRAQRKHDKTLKRLRDTVNTDQY